MRKQFIPVLAVAALCTSVVPVAPAFGQQFLGYDPIGTPICAGPLGPGPCADVYRYLQQQQMGAQFPGSFPTPTMGQPGIAGLPGAGLLPQDGQIVAGIAQSCGGEPVCMASAWGAVEIQRCRNGIGVPGGCFGPNGEIMQIVNRVVPQHLRPDVIVRNIEEDIRNGFGPNNEICRHTPLC